MLRKKMTFSTRIKII